MCRHILNSQVYVQSFCCGKWFECSECHDEVEKDHQFTVDRVLRLMCKCCQRVFQRDLTALMESDKFCEQCQNLWCLPGTTPESVVFNKSKGLILSMFNTLIDNAGLDPSLMPPPEDYSMTKSKALQGKT